MKQKEIEKKFTRKSFSYEQMDRAGSICLYKYSFKGTDKVQGYEVVKLYTDKTGQEYFPGSSLWGIKGWTYLPAQLKEATLKFKTLKTEEAKTGVVKGVFKGKRNTVTI